MPKMHDFAREERLPSYFMNAIQDFLSGARTDLRLTRKDATHVQVAPVEPYGIAAIDLEGRWRWNDATVSRAHPGGAEGTYSVWAVALDQDVSESPKPFTDDTVYTFELRITNGEDPSGAGVEVFEKIGEVDWDGAKITALRQTYNAVTGPMLADGALSNEGDVSWAREANGAWVPQLKANSVGSSELADLSVDTAALIDLCVVTAKVAAEAITEGKLAEGSVVAAKIAALAVTSAKLAAKAVTEEKVGDEAISTAKMKLLAVTSAILAAEAVTESKVATGAIAEAKLAALSVSTAKLQNLAVTAAKIGEEAVSTIKIANLAVTSAKLAELAVTEAKIADGAVTSRKFKPSVGMIAGEETNIAGGGLKDVKGAVLEITPAVASKLMVWGIWLVIVGDNPNLHVFNVGWSVDGVDRPESFYEAHKESEGEVSLHNFDLIDLTAAKHTIKMRAGIDANVPALCKGTNHTRFMYQLVAA